MLPTISPERFATLVDADDAEREDFRLRRKSLQVSHDIGGSSEADALVADAEDGNGRLLGKPEGIPGNIGIEHEIAEHGDAERFGRLDERSEPSGRNVGEHKKPQRVLFTMFASMDLA